MACIIFVGFNLFVGKVYMERIDKILGQTNVGFIICINSVYSSQLTTLLHDPARNLVPHLVVARRAVSSFNQAITSPYPACRRPNTSKKAEYPVLEAVSTRYHRLWNF